MKKISTISVHSVYKGYKHSFHKSRDALAIVYGIVKKIKPIKTVSGTSGKLVGDFEAIRMPDGEKFSSDFCVTDDSITSKIQQSLKDSAIEIAIQIDYIKDSSSLTGIGFIYNEIEEIKTHDHLETMRNKFDTVYLDMVKNQETKGNTKKESTTKEKKP